MPTMPAPLRGGQRIVNLAFAAAYLKTGSDGLLPCLAVETGEFLKIP